MTREQVLAKAYENGVNIKEQVFFGVSGDGQIFENHNLARNHARETKGEVFTYTREELKPLITFGDWVEPATPEVPLSEEPTMEPQLEVQKEAPRAKAKPKGK